MAQSKRSRYVREQTAWIIYQKNNLGIAEGAVSTEAPQQFKDIFWLGHDYAVANQERKAK